MIPQIIYVETSKIYLLLHDRKILQIQKKTGLHINPHAIRVECLDVTADRTRVHVADRNDWANKSKLLLDAWALTDFVALLSKQMPNASTKAFGNALLGFFPGSMSFRDIAEAAIWAAGVPGTRRPAGDQHYYIARARASNPEGFAELAAGYAAWRQTPQRH